MAEYCKKCNCESLMFSNIGAIFGILPFCINPECEDYKEFTGGNHES